METTKIHFSTHIRLTVGIILPVKCYFIIKETKEASEMEQIKVGRFITKKRKEQKGE